MFLKWNYEPTENLRNVQSYFIALSGLFYAK